MIKNKILSSKYSNKCQAHRFLGHFLCHRTWLETFPWTFPMLAKWLEAYESHS